MTYIGDANDRTTILGDADFFFRSSSYFAATDADETTTVNSYFGPDPDPPPGTQCPSKHFRFPAYWSSTSQQSPG